MGVLTGNVLMPSDQLDATQGDAALLSTVGALLDTIPSSTTPANDTIPYCDLGDILPNGNWCTPYQDVTGVIQGICFFDDNNQLITTNTAIISGFTDPTIFVRSDHNTSFWVLVVQSSQTGNLYQFSSTGTLLNSYIGIVDNARPDYPTVSMLFQGFCVSYDGSTMYVAQGNIAPATIYKYTITTDTWTNTAVLSIASFRIDQVDALILCNGGNTLAVSVREPLGSGDMLRYVKIYTLPGLALIATFNAGTTGDPNEMGVNPADDTAIWVKTLGAGALTYTVYKLSVADLTNLQSSWGGNTLENGGQVPVSCPLLVFPASSALAGSGIYKIVPGAGKRNDTLWDAGFSSTTDVAIPDPHGITGYVGD